MASSPAEPVSGIEPADYNPMLPHVREDPYPYYRALRRRAPVHPLAPGAPIFAVSRYQDVRSVLQQPELFSSTAFDLLAQGAVGIGPNSGVLAGHRLLASPMMIAVDPPDHGRLRRLVNRGFTPRRIADLEPRLREIAGGFVDRVRASGRMDLVRDLAIPFPVTVIAELLGVEARLHEQFKHWSDALVLGLSGVSQFGREEVLRAADELAEHLASVAAERRARPREDLISVLVQAEGGDALSDSEVLAFTLLLLIAGNETTTNLIGNAAKALLAHPDQLEAVQSDPTRIPAMLEEALRYDPPIQSLPRRVQQDTELAGCPLPAGSFVMVLFGSANRDETVFPDPDRFDVERNPQGHLAFGYGIHFCLGAALARLEARVAFETLLGSCANLRLAGEIPLVDSLLLRGPKSLPLEFTAA